MRSILPILGAAAGLLVASLTPASAQRVELDQVSGKYRVEYHSSHLGRTVSAVVDPPNRIDPALHLLRVDDANGTLAYHYEASNGRGGGSRQALVEFEFNCPPRALVAGEPAPGWDISLGTVASRHVCAFIEGSEGEQRVHGITPGDRLSGFEVRTARLPASGIAYFWGDADGVEWPEGESAEVRDLQVVRAVQQLTGVSGGWVERVVVVPLRDPQLRPLGILDGLRGDLDRICEVRDYIVEPLCRSYRADLAELVTAVREERFGTARERIQTFLNDLQAAHESPRRQLEPDAYWLLRTNLEAVAARLQESLSAEGHADSTEVRGFWSRLWSALRTLPPA